MQQTKKIALYTLTASILLSSCSSMNKTQKGAIFGAAGGAIVGGVIGKFAKNPALGAIIGAGVGGTAGAVIGKKMDKQAEEIQKSVPTAKVERVGEGIVVEFSSKILFAINKADLSATAKNNLKDLLTVLNKYPDTNIEVQGHTDNTGTPALNQTLSEKRAAGVAAYLIQNGIAASRITTKGYGQTAPKYSNDTEEGRSQNRNVQFEISANEKMKAEAAKEASGGK